MSCSHESAGSYNSILRSVMDSALYFNSMNNDMSVNSNNDSAKSNSTVTNNNYTNEDNNNNNIDKDTKSLGINSL